MSEIPPYTICMETGKVVYGISCATRPTPMKILEKTFCAAARRFYIKATVGMESRSTVERMWHM